MRMERNTDCTGDAAPAIMETFNFADRMRFQSLLHGMVEELKMRRELDIENEKKIKKLLNDKFSLGWKWDQSLNEISSLNQQHSVDLRESKRKNDDKIREHKIEVSQNQMYKRLIEKERDTLRQEMTKLQLTNYSLEKQSREAERLEKMLTDEREEHLKQVSEFENQRKNLMNDMKKLTEKQDKMDRDFLSIQKLQSKLMYENRHYQCVLHMKDEEIIKLRENLLSSRLESKIDPQVVADREDQLKDEIKLLKQQIEVAEECGKSIGKEKEFFREKFLKTQDQLTESHRLVQIHLHTAGDYRDESRKLQTEKQDCINKIRDTGNKLSDVQKQLADLQHAYSDDTKDWENQTEEFRVKVKQLETEIESQAKIIDEETTNLREKTQHIEDLTEELNQAKAILNVEKSTTECQTILHMLETSDNQVQVEVDTRNKESQTSVSVESQSSQTIDSATKNSGVQTIIVEVSNGEVQTESGTQHDENTQTHRQATGNIGTQTDYIQEKQKEIPIPDKDTHLPSSKKDKLPETDKALEISAPKIFSALHNQPHEQHKVKQYVNEIQCLGKENRNENDQDKCEEVGRSGNDPAKDNTGDEITLNNNIGQKQSMNEAERFSIVSDRDHAETSDATRYDKLQACDNIDSDSRDNGDESSGPDIGISVPKLDLHKDLLMTDQVQVDPDEFNVSLTQDEIALDNTEDTLEYNSVPDDVDKASEASIITNGPPRAHFVEAPNISTGTNINDMKNRRQDDKKNSKIRDQKLSTTEIQNYFNEFEERGKIFKGVSKRPGSPNENKSKLAKLSKGNEDFRSDMSKGTSKDNVDAPLLDNYRGTTADVNEDFRPSVESNNRVFTSTSNDNLSTNPYTDNKRSLYQPKTLDKHEKAQVLVPQHEEQRYVANSSTHKIQSDESLPDRRTSNYTTDMRKKQADQRYDGYLAQNIQTTESLTVSKASGDTPDWRKSAVFTRGGRKESNKFNTQPPTMKAFDIMQRYKDTVAKVKPMQGQVRQGKQTESQIPITAGPSTMVTSPRVGTVRGILKGPREANQGRSRNVTWNETVENKLILD